MLLIASSLSLVGVVETDVPFPSQELPTDQYMDDDPPGPRTVGAAPRAPTSYFTENMGQWGVDLLFVGSTNFGHVGLGRDGFYYNLLPLTSRVGSEPPVEVLRKSSAPGSGMDYRGTRGHVIKASFDGTTASSIIGVDALGHRSTYIPREWPSSEGSVARNFREVHYKALYPGVDLVFRFDGGQLKYDLHVEPGGDIDAVRFIVEGADIEVHGDDLLFMTPVGDVRDSGLIAYGSDSGEPVGGSYVLWHDAFGFSVPARPTSEGLVIDPLVFGTYVGGYDNEQEARMAVDDEGYAYVTGWTGSSDFPTTPGAYEPDFNPMMSLFVLKLEPDGSSLVFSTYFDAPYNQGNLDIATGPDGTCYITGCTSDNDFPVTSGAINSSNQRTVSLPDIFVVRFSADGSSLVFSAAVGGSGYDRATSIDVDIEGNAYVTGYTGSRDLPTTAGAYCDTLAEGHDPFMISVSPTRMGKLMRADMIIIQLISRLNGRDM